MCASWFPACPCLGLLAFLRAVGLGWTRFWSAELCEKRCLCWVIAFLSQTWEHFSDLPASWKNYEDYWELTFVSTLEYRKQFHRHRKCDSDSGWLIERPLIEQNSKAGRPARERAGFRWLDIRGPETQLVFYLLPTLLSEATTRSFEISKGFDLTVRSLLKSKEGKLVSRSL